MSSQSVEVVREGNEAFNQRDADRWLSYAAPEIEWIPGGPAAIERSIYRGRDEVADGLASLWQTWDLFRLEEAEVRDLGDSMLWLGRARLRGSASRMEVDQEFAVHFLVRAGKFIRIRAFLTWSDALEAVGLRE
jgi:ketosteroid isomerase-like protein